MAPGGPGGPGGQQGPRGRLRVPWWDGEIGPAFHDTSIPERIDWERVPAGEGRGTRDEGRGTRWIDFDFRKIKYLEGFTATSSQSQDSVCPGSTASIPPWDWIRCSIFINIL